MPLADGRRGIASRLQEFRDRHLVRIQTDLGCRRQRSEDRHTRCVTTGQQRRSRRRAHTFGGMEISEPHPLFSKPIEVRRGEADRPEGADIGVSLIVGEDHDDVRGASAGKAPAQPTRCRQREPCRTRSREERSPRRQGVRTHRQTHRHRWYGTGSSAGTPKCTRIESSRVVRRA